MVMREQRQNQPRLKTGTESHGSSLPPRSHGRLPEGPVAFQLLGQLRLKVASRSSELYHPNGSYQVQSRLSTKSLGNQILNGGFHQKRSFS